jgi:hypothetical protein
MRHIAAVSTGGQQRSNKSALGLSFCRPAIYAVVACVYRERNNCADMLSYVCPNTDSTKDAARTCRGAWIMYGDCGIWRTGTENNSQFILRPPHDFVFDEIADAGRDIAMFLRSAVGSDMFITAHFSSDDNHLIVAVRIRHVFGGGYRDRFGFHCSILIIGLAIILTRPPWPGQ